MQYCMLYWIQNYFINNFLYQTLFDLDFFLTKQEQKEQQQQQTTTTTTILMGFDTIEIGLVFIFLMVVGSLWLVVLVKINFSVQLWSKLRIATSGLIQMSGKLLDHLSATVFTYPRSIALLRLSSPTILSSGV